MVDIAEIGERVAYTGDVTIADRFTKDLMIRRLIKSDLYTISYISYWQDVPFYSFLEIHEYRFPSNSFSKTNFRKYMKEKYKLR